MGDTSQEAAMEQYVELVDSLLRRRHSVRGPRPVLVPPLRSRFSP